MEPETLDMVGILCDNCGMVLAICKRHGCPVCLICGWHDYNGPPEGMRYQAPLYKDVCKRLVKGD